MRNDYGVSSISGRINRGLLPVALMVVFGISIGTGMASAVSLDTHFDGLPAGGELRGNAAISDGLLRLTNAENSQNGTFVWDPVEVYPSVLMRGSVLIGGGDGADGLSFSYSDLGEGSFGEFGSGNGFILRVVTYSGSDPGPRFDVLYGGEVINRQSVDNSVMRLNRFVPIEVLVEHTGDYVVKYNNIVYLQGTIAGWAPQAGWKVAVAARTGGLNDNHHFDSLQVGVVPLEAVPATPTMVTALIDTQATFRVTATGAVGTPEYQWYKVGPVDIELSMEKTDTLLLADLNYDSEGQYFCEVKTDTQEARSPYFTLRVEETVPVSSALVLFLMVTTVALCGVYTIRCRQRA